MPLFGYKYPECGATVEKLQKFEDRPPLCHSCGDAQMERQVSQTGPWKFGGEK